MYLEQGVIHLAFKYEVAVLAETNCLAPPLAALVAILWTTDLVESNYHLFVTFRRTLFALNDRSGGRRSGSRSACRPLNRFRTTLYRILDY